jgi:hypothetical protein
MPDVTDTAPRPRPPLRVAERITITPERRGEDRPKPLVIRFLPPRAAHPTDAGAAGGAAGHQAGAPHGVRGW